MPGRGALTCPRRPASQMPTPTPSSIGDRTMSPWANEQHAPPTAEQDPADQPGRQDDDHRDDDLPPSDGAARGQPARYQSHGRRHGDNGRCPEQAARPDGREEADGYVRRLLDLGLQRCRQRSDGAGVRRHAVAPWRGCRPGDRRAPGRHDEAACPSPSPVGADDPVIIRPSRPPTEGERTRGGGANGPRSIGTSHAGGPRRVPLGSYRLSGRTGCGGSAGSSSGSSCWCCSSSAAIRLTTFHPPAVASEAVVCPADAPELTPGQAVKVLSWNIQYLAGKDYVFWYDLFDESGPDDRPSRGDRPHARRGLAGHRRRGPRRHPAAGGRRRGGTHGRRGPARPAARSAGQTPTPATPARSTGRRPSSRIRASWARSA
jgi:hypothetical protein